VFACGLDDPSAFEDVVGDGLFDVDIFACLDGPDGTQGVPMIRGSDAHRVDRFVFKQFADVFDPHGLFATLFLGGFIAAALAGFFIAVADVGHHRAGSACKAIDVGLTSTSSADDGDLDRIVWTDRWGLLLGFVGLCLLSLESQGGGGGEHGLF